MSSAYEHLTADQPSEPPSDSLTLPFDLRQKSRFLTKLDSGKEVALLLPRAACSAAAIGCDGRTAWCSRSVRANEPCSTVRAKDPVHLLRVAYHLGNRHMPLQVGAGFVRYLRDHVLDEMVRGLGAEVVHELAPFEPEGGAYGGHGHSHD